MNSKVSEKEIEAIEFLKSVGYKVMLDPNFIDPNILYLVRFTEKEEIKFVTRRSERGRGPQKKGAEIAKLVLDQLDWQPIPKYFEKSKT